MVLKACTQLNSPTRKARSTFSTPTLLSRTSWIGGAWRHCRVRPVGQRVGAEVDDDLMDSTRRASHDLHLLERCRVVVVRASERACPFIKGGAAAHHAGFEAEGIELAPAQVWARNRRASSIGSMPMRYGPWTAVSMKFMSVRRTTPSYA